MAQSRRRIDPIAQFMQEHDRALMQLSSLNQATRSLENQGFSLQAYDRVLRALEFIEEEVSIHNKREEEALFPVLERYVEGPTKRMRDEHRILRKEFRKLRAAVTKLGKNRFSKEAAGSLALTSQTMVHLMVNHIHKENHILFPLVQRFLTKEALREVARRMI